MTSEEMDRHFEEMMEIYRKLEQFQVECEENHARWHVNFQRSLDALVQQQAKASAEMAELRDWGKELAKSQVRMQNSVADLTDSHRRLQESMRELAETQKRADERLNSFLAALERRFGSNGHF
jgi:chromosome segregation ATPase